jgi:hypothetical protein
VEYQLALLRPLLSMGVGLVQPMELQICSTTLKLIMFVQALILLLLPYNPIYQPFWNSPALLKWVSAIIKFATTQQDTEVTSELLRTLFHRLVMKQPFELRNQIYPEENNNNDRFLFTILLPLLMQ